MCVVGEEGGGGVRACACVRACVRVLRYFFTYMDRGSKFCLKTKSKDMHLEAILTKCDRSMGMQMGVGKGKFIKVCRWGVGVGRSSQKGVDNSSIHWSLRQD